MFSRRLVYRSFPHGINNTMHQEERLQCTVDGRGRSRAAPKESKHTEASFSPVSTDSFCLRVAQMPRSRDVAIFVATDDRKDKTRLLF